MKSAPCVQAVALIACASLWACSRTGPGSPKATSPSTECDQQRQESIKKPDALGESHEYGGYKGALLVSPAESGPCTPLLGRRLAEIQAGLWNSKAALVAVAVTSETLTIKNNDSVITPEVWTYRFMNPQGDSQLYVSMNRRGIQRVSRDDGVYDPRRFPSIGHEWKRDVNASAPILRAVKDGQSVWIRHDFDLRVDGRRIPRGRTLFDAATGDGLYGPTATELLKVLDAQDAQGQNERK